MNFGSRFALHDSDDEDEVVREDVPSGTLSSMSPAPPGQSPPQEHARVSATATCLLHRGRSPSMDQLLHPVTQQPGQSGLNNREKAGDGRGEVVYPAGLAFGPTSLFEGLSLSSGRSKSRRAAPTPEVDNTPGQVQGTVDQDPSIDRALSRESERTVHQVLSTQATQSEPVAPVKKNGGLPPSANPVVGPRPKTPGSFGHAKGASGYLPGPHPGVHTPQNQGSRTWRRKV